MKGLLKTTLFLLTIISGPLYASDDPLEFFKSYVQLGESFDSDLANLYSEDALIHTYRVYPHGLERNMELTGAQWKALISRVMPIAKAQNDKSTFSDIAVTEIDGGYKIKADRYSVRKCYTDTGYYMIVKPTKNGSLTISEEYMETKPLPSC